MSLAPELIKFLDTLHTTMFLARELGLYRTTEQLHMALNEARSEVFEIIPPSSGESYITEMIVGPPYEQPNRRA
jgi:hypothetical protein